MIRFTILAFSFLKVSLSFSQNPLVKQWDYRFGGSNNDILGWLVQTSDGGFALCGYSYSDSSGDKTEPSWGGPDFWVVKVDSIGNKQWDKRFGGTEGEQLHAAIQSNDGGYLLVGYSYSGIGGNKTEDNWDPTHYTWDYWVVKIDSAGNYQWDKRYGGMQNDYAYAVCQTSNGDYLVAGMSESSVSGDKTQQPWGSFDQWVVKIDAAGNKIWDKRFGGVDFDAAYAVLEISDGGYLIAGSSLSDSSGDKTQHSWGNSDLWMVKTDTAGNKIWDKRYGGTQDESLRSALENSDGGFLLAGWSNSPASGDKASDLWGWHDLWVVATNANGIKQWDKNYGGTFEEDELGNIAPGGNGSYLVAGTSYSDSSGNKTEDNWGNEQTWVLRITATGEVIWDKTLWTNTGYSADDEIGFAYTTGHGCYIMANYTLADSGGYISQGTRGWTDYWIIKFCDTTFVFTNSPSVISPDQHVFSIYPNPFMNNAMIVNDREGIYDFMMYDVLGREAMRSKIIGSTTQIERGNLPSGVYFYQIKEGRQLIESGKVVVE